MVYDIIAYTGTILSVIIFAGLLFGFFDLDLDTDFDSDSSFKVFSLQNISYFSMTGGWAGVWAVKQGYEINSFLAIFLFVSGGLVSVVVSQLIMIFAKRLNHTPKVDYNSAVGKNGKLTVSISPKSAGKVQTVVSGKLMELTAHYHKEDTFVPAGTLVKIKEVTNNNELIVV